MRKIYTIVLLILLTMEVYGQKYMTKNGECHFSASVPAFEAIEASTKKMVGILDTSSGAVAALIEIQSFVFPISLMQEHFNENYMDSKKYPKATFKGEINYFTLSKDTVSENVKGVLSIHGVKKEVVLPVVYFQKNELIIIKSNFEIKPEEYKIKIPKVITEKIAETVIIELYMELTKKQ